jgi:hypothetical protein
MVLVKIIPVRISVFTEYHRTTPSSAGMSFFFFLSEGVFACITAA